ncbi:MAG TPA: cytochrome c biogenesis protein CcsA [Candidatus Omnitrophota bacterium]|nr:cytochrome c biogenesis protein CcsA [Candidatus Omnitrophota bacterium]
MSMHALTAFALLSLLPAALVPLRAGAGRDGAFWAVTALAVAGPAALASALVAGAWQTDLGTTLWVSIAASAALFGVVALGTRFGWRLAPLLMPYLAVMGLLAHVVRGEPKPMVGGAPALWVDLHILVSVLTYGLLTLAAVASLGVFLQERALKRKRPTRLTRMLPSVVDGERLADRLLVASEAVLGLGLATGMATQYFETGVLLQLGHKTLLSLVAFVLIGALLAGHRVCGVRGRMAARVVLVAYLLVTLAFPGVKFVTQVLL